MPLVAYSIKNRDDNHALAPWVINCICDPAQALTMGSMKKTLKRSWGHSVANGNLVLVNPRVHKLMEIMIMTIGAFSH